MCNLLFSQKSFLALTAPKSEIPVLVNLAIYGFILEEDHVEIKTINDNILSKPR